MNCQELKSGNEVFSKIMNEARDAFKMLDNRGRRKLFAKLNAEFRPGKSNSTYKAYYRKWEQHVMNLADEARAFTVMVLLQCIEEVYVDLQSETESQIEIAKRKIEDLTRFLPKVQERIELMTIFKNLNN